jgi:hypothetical protein
MSRGAGRIESRIADLFAATRDRALTIDDIVSHAFKLRGGPATRRQRLLRRVREAQARAEKLGQQAHKSAEAALGREERHEKTLDKEFNNGLRSDPAWREGEELREFVYRIGVWLRFEPLEGNRIKAARDYWCTTTVQGRLYFHPPDVPVRVWAVSIEPAGVIWAEAEVVRVTERNVVARYAGATARLDRQRLWHWWAWWRGVRFVSSRSGRIAAALDHQWQERFASGRAPPFMQMQLAEAMALLGVRGTKRRRTCSRPSGGRRRRRIPTLAARPRCSASWSRRVIGCWGRLAPAHRHRRCPSTPRRGGGFYIAVADPGRGASARPRHG